MASWEENLLESSSNYIIRVSPYVFFFCQEVLWHHTPICAYWEFIPCETGSFCEIDLDSIKLLSNDVFRLYICWECYKGRIKVGTFLLLCIHEGQHPNSQCLCHSVDHDSQVTPGVLHAVLEVRILQGCVQNGVGAEESSEDDRLSRNQALQGTAEGLGNIQSGEEGVDPGTDKRTRTWSLS